MKAFNIGLALLLSLSLFGFKSDTNIYNTEEIIQSPQVRIKEDTENPTIKFKDLVVGLDEVKKVDETTKEENTIHQITIAIDSEFDLTKYLEVNDNSGNVYTISFGNLDTKKVGIYDITLIAVDDWNNASDVNIEVKVVSAEDYATVQAEFDAKLEAERERLAYEAYLERKSAAISFASRIGANGAGGRSDIASFAQSFVGYGYVFGGASPETGFDCSGFMQYVFGQFGISISRGVEGQAYNGYSVSPENAAPGDMLIFSDSYTTDVTHIGLYIGGDYFVHAANPSKGVIISSISGWVGWGAGSIYDIRRVW